MAADVEIVDLDSHSPTDDEILSFVEMLRAPDQIEWDYDIEWTKEPTTPQREIEEYRKREVRDRGIHYGFWAMRGGKVIGMIGIHRCSGPARRHCAEVGLGVLKAFTRRGIAFRLLTSAIAKARTVGFKRLEADCFGENEPSARLLLKAGFREEGRAVGSILRDGKLRDQRLFGMLL